MDTPADLTHAGGVVYRADDGGNRMLIVRARRPPYYWVLPKGHIEAGESPKEASLKGSREIGFTIPRTISASPATRWARGSARWVVSDAVRGHGAGQENREIRWCSFSEAWEVIRFENLRET
jgi:8-oxo-dGTP pyrophosphatase MutT (NUDIX family)